jgi:hypothetical protein
LGLAGSGWAYSVVSKSIWLSGSKVSSFLDFEVFDLDFDDFFEGLVLVGGWGASSSSIWLSSSVMGASDTVDWVERRDDVLETRDFFDREDFDFLPGGCAKTKNEQSADRR